jgi:predicted peptidase
MNREFVEMEASTPPLNLTKRTVIGRWRLWIVLCAVWIGANLVLYFDPFEWLARKPKRPTAAALRLYQERVWPSPSPSGDDARRLLYRVLEPTDTSKPQPLLLFLQGAGERGGDNQLQLIGLPSQLAESRWRKMFTGFVIAPQCPKGESWTGKLDAVESLLDEWRKNPRVDRRRVYVTGLSMGGYGTWSLAARRPEWFAAAVPICGGGEIGTAEKLVSVPIWAVHGLDDQSVLPKASREMIESIRVAGGKPQLLELPGVGHDSWTQTYRDPHGVLAWMFRQLNDRCIECR